MPWKSKFLQLEKDYTMLESDLHEMRAHVRRLERALDKASTEAGTCQKVLNSIYDRGLAQEPF
jgi:cob(I)alamin adenosyltransferase